MDEKQARKILKDEIEGNGELYSLGRYMAWSTNDARASLDGLFTSDELEAVAWWMKNKGETMNTLKSFIDLLENELGGGVENLKWSVDDCGKPGVPGVCGNDNEGGGRKRKDTGGTCKNGI